MKIFSLFFVILILCSCGIDKEGSSTQPSITDNAGELDISFNTFGYLALHNSAGGNNNDEIFDMAVDSQDRVVAVGRSINSSSNTDLVVYRLTPTGSLDTSFSGDGIFIHSNAAGTGNDTGYGLVIGSNDEIYVTGSSYNGSDFDMVTWKITSSGSLDSSFNGTGFLVHDNAAGGGQHDTGYDIALDSSGNIFVAGFSERAASDQDMAVWKISSNGSLDTSFDSDGFYTEDNSAGGTNEVANSIAVSSSGKIIVAGYVDTLAQGTDMAVWQFTSVGAIDTSFSSDGFYRHNQAAGGNSDDKAEAIVVDSSGNYVITGSSMNSSGNNDMTLWKLSSSGVLDSDFDSNGYTTFDVSSIEGSNTNDRGLAIHIDSEQRILVSGVGNQNMCVWRYNSDGSLDSEFNLDGFFSHDSAGGGFDVDSGFGVFEDSQKRVYIGGTSETTAGDQDAIFWRLK